MDFAVLVDHRVKIKEKKREKYLDLAWNLKKNIEHEGDDDNSCNWCSWNDSKGLVSGLKELEIREWAETIETTALLG